MNDTDDTDDYYIYFYVIYYQIFNYIKIYGNIKKILKNINKISSFIFIKKILTKKFDDVNHNIDIKNNFERINKIFKTLDEIN